MQSSLTFVVKCKLVCKCKQGYRERSHALETSNINDILATELGKLSMIIEVTRNIGL